MIIKDVRITSMALPLRTQYVWSQGTEDVFCVNLIELVGEDGTVGIGETTTAPDAGAQAIVLQKLGQHFIGRSLMRHKSWRRHTGVISWSLVGTCHAMQIN